MPITVQFKGVEAAIKELKQLPPKLVEVITEELHAGAQDIVKTAKNFAPVFDGFLRASISAELKPMQADIVVNAFYASYVEFGTGRYAASYVASLPSDWSTYAAKFKGKNAEAGGADQFFENILRWVRLKGIRFDSAATFKSGTRIGQNRQLSYEQTAYFIFHYILINGIHPHPFLYPAFVNHEPAIVAGVNQAIKKLLI